MKTMKLDLKKLAKIEKEYADTDSAIALNTLQTMIDVVLHFNDNSLNLAPDNVKIAVTTLKGLGIYKEAENTTEPIQLNS